jgi:hypothetical protein
LAAVGPGADNHILRHSAHRPSPSGCQKNDTAANDRPPVIDRVSSIERSVVGVPLSDAVEGPLLRTI